MKFHEVLDDREPQSKPAESPRDRSIGLMESLEHIGEELALDPRAGIDYREFRVGANVT